MYSSGNICRASSEKEAKLQRRVQPLTKYVNIISELKIYEYHYFREHHGTPLFMDPSAPDSCIIYLFGVRASIGDAC